MSLKVWLHSYKQDHDISIVFHHPRDPKDCIPELSGDLRCSSPGRSLQDYPMQQGCGNRVGHCGKLNYC